MDILTQWEAMDELARSEANPEVAGALNATSEALFNMVLEIAEDAGELAYPILQAADATLLAARRPCPFPSFIGCFQRNFWLNFAENVMETVFESEPSEDADPISPSPPAAEGPAAATGRRLLLLLPNQDDAWLPVGRSGGGQAWQSAGAAKEHGWARRLLGDGLQQAVQQALPPGGTLQTFFLGDMPGCTP